MIGDYSVIIICTRYRQLSVNNSSISSRSSSSSSSSSIDMKEKCQSYFVFLQHYALLGCYRLLINDKLSSLEIQRVQRQSYKYNFGQTVFTISHHLHQIAI